MSSPRTSVLGHGDLAASLLYIFPLFIAYQIGVLFSGSINGADFVTRATLALVGGDRMLYLAIQLALALLFFGLVVVLMRRRSLRLSDGLPMVIESAIYALTLGSVILLLLDQVLGMSTSLGTTALSAAEEFLFATSLGNTGEAFVASIGAGVYEELVFRLGLFAGGAAALRALGVRPSLALLVALLGSSALFSAAHHVGDFGEAFETRVFVYRALAGLAFAAIFYFRSLAHAVYSHFLYDVYVLVIHP